MKSRQWRQRAGWLVEFQGRQECWAHGRKTLHWRANVGGQQGPLHTHTQEHIHREQARRATTEQDWIIWRSPGVKTRLLWAGWWAEWKQVGLVCCRRSQPHPPATHMACRRKNRKGRYTKSHKKPQQNQNQHRINQVHFCGGGVMEWEMFCCRLRDIGHLVQNVRQGITRMPLM